jgi:hypothetical protein
LLIRSDYGHNDPFEQSNFLPILRAKEDLPSRVAEKMVRDNLRVLRHLIDSSESDGDGDRVGHG